MSILIVGGGAIGQWLGGMLTEQAGCAVTLLVKPSQLQQSSPTAIPKICQLPAGAAFEDVIFAVKAFQLEQAAAQVTGAGLDIKRVWGFQNGLGSDSLLAAHFPEIWYGSMTTTIPVHLENGRPKPGIKGGLAWASGHQPSQAPGWLKHLHVPVRAVARIDSLKCSKLLLNLTCNATCALLDMLPGEVVAHKAMFSFELACLREFLAVVRANNIPFVDLPAYKVTHLVALANFPDFAIRSLLGLKITRARGKKPPSLLVDLRSGRQQSEVEVLNGGVVALGKLAGIATPANDWLLTSLSKVVADQALWKNYKGQIDQVAQQALHSLKPK